MFSLGLFIKLEHCPVLLRQAGLQGIRRLATHDAVSVPHVERCMSSKLIMLCVPHEPFDAGRVTLPISQALNALGFMKDIMGK